MKLNVGLVFGGRSGEHEVSLQSARSIAENIDRNKYYLYLIAIDKEGSWYLADQNNYLQNEDDPGTIRLNVTGDQRIAIVPDGDSNQMINLKDHSGYGKLDVVFPIIHGTFGEDGSLQGYFSMLNIPYVGADVLGSAVGMNKLLAKKLLLQENIPVAKYLLVTKDSEINKVAGDVDKLLGYPVFVKPVCSGSSVGVFKVSERDELSVFIKKALAFDRQVLIEEAVIGREIECSVLGNTDLFASVAGEVIPKNSFYSYEAKYIDADGARLDMPADLPDDTTIKVRKLAKKAYKALSCSGMARVDMFLTSDNKLVINEINTLPGFTGISMYPKLLALSGISFNELIDNLIDLAVERHREDEIYLNNVLKESRF